MVLYAGAYIKGVYSNIRYRIRYRITNHLHSDHCLYSIPVLSVWLHEQGQSCATVVYQIWLLLLRSFLATVFLLTAPLLSDYEFRLHAGYNRTYMYTTN